MNLIWKYDIEKPRFETLQGDIKTDVLVIGGGLTGLLCGYYLKKRGIDCVIAEADRICSGVSGNTTAKITLHHGAIFDKMEKRFGSEWVAKYLKANGEALQEYKALCRDIDCDFCVQDSFVYSRTDQNKIEKEVRALNKAGVKAKFCDDMPLPFSAVGVRVEKQGQFNPLKFAFAIAKDLKIYENTRVVALSPNYALTEKGKIKAEKIIVATHFPFLNKHGGYFIKMYQHRSYVLALENAKKIDGMYVDGEDKGLSFRSYKNLLLLGGGGHRTGKKGGNWNELENFAEQYYPNAKTVTRFATQDCKTLDDIPYIGQYSQKTPNLYVATGFNKWGMTSAMVSARLLTDLAEGKPNDFASVFAPDRNFLRPQLAVNGFESTVSILTPSAPRCPHLGCALKYNKAEHSWDCPCHSSRFTEKGRVINNPANCDKKFKA